MLQCNHIVLHSTPYFDTNELTRICLWNKVVYPRKLDCSESVKRKYSIIQDSGYSVYEICNDTLVTPQVLHLLEYLVYADYCQEEIMEKFPLAPMGVLAPGSAQARPSARPPIDTSGNFPAHVSAESPSNISPNPLEVYPKFRNPRTNFEIFKKNF